MTYSQNECSPAELSEDCDIYPQQLEALQRAIEIGHISVRDRLQNSAMLCGNN